MVKYLGQGFEMDAVKAIIENTEKEQPDTFRTYIIERLPQIDGYFDVFGTTHPLRLSAFKEK